MEGPQDNRGVNFRALEELFRLCHERREEFKYELQVSMLEIYNEAVQDLLGGNKKEKLDIRLVGGAAQWRAAKALTLSFFKNIPYRRELMGCTSRA